MLQEVQRSPTAVLMAALPAASDAARRQFILRLSNSLERVQLPRLLQIYTDGNVVLSGPTVRLLLPARCVQLGHLRRVCCRVNSRESGRKGFGATCD